jgi:hypothetical protein
LVFPTKKQNGNFAEAGPDGIDRFSPFPLEFPFVFQSFSLTQQDGFSKLFVRLQINGKMPVLEA